MIEPFPLTFRIGHVANPEIPQMADASGGFLRYTAL